MKRDKIIYWSVTILFAAFMMSSAIPDALVTKDAIDFMAKLGYPQYFVQFIGVAKFLGIIAILLPGFARIKEWAYAGLAFDLIGAMYSLIVVGGMGLGWTFLFLPLIFLAVSYIYYHKILKAKATV